MDTLETIVNSCKPRCLSEVSATPTHAIQKSECISISYALSDPSTGSEFAKVLGHPLRDYNPEFSTDTDFISPLSVCWTDAIETVIFDSDIHGYHGEMEASAKLHGEGPKKAFACISCHNETFSVSVQLDYWDACEDLLEDEPDLSVQDFFCNIIVQGVCQQCGSRNVILNMDL